MSLYPFQAAKLTTDADRLRHPIVNKGQLVRTLMLFVVFVLALTLVARQSRAVESQPTGRQSNTSQPSF